MSVYGPEDARGAKVYEVETGRELRHVSLVDTSAGVVVRFEHPFRVVGEEAATFNERFEMIYPIYGREPAPVLFHCYGRKG